MSQEAAQPAEPIIGTCPFARRAGTRLLFPGLPETCFAKIKLAERWIACGNVLSRGKEGKLTFSGCCSLELLLPDVFKEHVELAYPGEEQARQNEVISAQTPVPFRFPGYGSQY